MIEAKSVPYEKRMTVGKVLSFTVAKFFKEITAVGQWFLLVLLLILINLIPIGLIVFSIAGTNDYIPALSSAANPFHNANLALMIPGALLMMIVFILDIAFGIFTIAWFNRLGLDAFDGEKRIFGQRFKLGLKDTYRLVGPVLLLGLFGFIAMVPNYITSAIDVGTGLSSEMSPFTSPLATLFYFVALIVTYFVSVKVVASYGLLLENPDMPVMECFKESFAMTKGRGWRIFGYFIALVILVILIGVALLIPGILLWVVAMVTNGNVGIIVVAVVISILLYVLMYAFGCGCQGMLYAGIYKFLLIEHKEEVAEPISVSNSYETVENPEEDNRE